MLKSLNDVGKLSKSRLYDKCFTNIFTPSYSKFICSDSWLNKMCIIDAEIKVKLWILNMNFVRCFRKSLLKLCLYNKISS